MTTNEYNRAIDLWADDLFSFAMYCCRDKARCDDAMQEAFAALWERHEEIELDKCKGFLMTVTQRRLIDSLRHDSRNESLNENSIVSNLPSASPHDQTDLKETIHTAMNLLPERQRTILTLHDIEGYSYQEIATMQEMNPSSVQVAAFRARVSLKKILTDIRGV